MEMRALEFPYEDVDGGDQDVYQEQGEGEGDEEGEGNYSEEHDMSFGDGLGRYEGEDDGNVGDEEEPEEGDYDGEEGALLEGEGAAGRGEVVEVGALDSPIQASEVHQDPDLLPVPPPTTQDVMEDDAGADSGGPTGVEEGDSGVEEERQTVAPPTPGRDATAETFLTQPPDSDTENDDSYMSVVRDLCPR